MAKIEDLTEQTLEAVNGALNGIRFRYWGRDVDSGKARVERWDASGFVYLEAVGSERECWQFAKGLAAALDTVGRL
jgi:hypothetical protein